MSKNYEPVPDFISRLKIAGAKLKEVTNKAKKAGVSMVIGAISFMFFNTAEAAGSRVVPLNQNPCQTELENADQSAVPSVLKRSRAAFERFDQRIKTDTSHLRPLFDEISTALSDIKAERVTVDGNPAEGSLKVAYLLPGQVILSVNKTLGLHEDHEVGFILMRNRELLVSDVKPLTFVHDYLLQLQSVLA